MRTATSSSQTFRPQNPSSTAAFLEGDAPFMKRIGERVSRELSSMQALLGEHADSGALLVLNRWARSTLSRIDQLADEGAIYPSRNAQLRSGNHNRSFSRALRLGVFPIAANPLHWMHLLCGLAAIERLRLDKVVYVIAGADPRKPALASEQVRHRVAKEVLAIFSPLLEYSAIARGSMADGEENAFRIIASNGIRPVHAFYIAGSDHYRRLAPSSGNPDTIQKLEDGVLRRAHGFDPHRHWVSAVFLDRGGTLESVQTFLEVHWITGLPLQISSSRIRGALVGERPLSELSLMPFSAYSAICTRGLYGSCPEVMAGGAIKQDFPQEGVELL